MKATGLDPYEALGNAVVLQAVKDYRRCYRLYLKRPENIRVKQAVDEVEGFMTGPYFNLYTSLDGKMLLKRLQEEMRVRI